MLNGKTVLTTGDVAKICNVAPRTVSKWFDSGQLRGYRIPGSKDRRIPVDHLIRFMRSHGMPINGLEAGRKRVLIIDPDAKFCETLEAALASGGDYEAAAASSALEAGALAQTFRPNVIIVDLGMADVHPAALVRFCQCDPDLQHAPLIAVAKGLNEGQGASLMHQGFAGWLSKPFEFGALLRIIEHGLNVEADARSGA